ncbi:MAG: hypothetical protein IJW40_03830 [Clostridia bacterium]|nr:hypothetical protein [Clostridia bacterium]
MKQLIVTMLVITLCLAAFSGCNKSETNDGFFLRPEAVEPLGDYEVITIQTISENGTLLGSTEAGDNNLVISLDEAVEWHSSK